MSKENNYLICETDSVYYTLAGISGFYGAFTYLLRGNVFCNAQTGNVVLMGLALGQGKWSTALYYLIPIFAYMLGSFFSELLPNPIKHTFKIRWDTLLIAIEMVAVAVLGALPETAPVQISQIAINFIASMQYNTFRQAEGVVAATTFVTNHVRQVGVGAAIELRHIGKKEKPHRRKWKTHFLMLLFFFTGVTVGTILCSIWEGKAIWLVLVPLAILLNAFISEDLRLGNENLERKPHGH